MINSQEDIRLPLINAINRTPWYWLFIVFVGSGLEAGALYYQYIVGDEPCVLCIHVRIWVAAFMLVGLIGLISYRSETARLASNILTIITAAGLTERSWQTLATEKGWAESSCAMDAGLPSWFDLERWFPAVFQVRDSCGFTPYIIGQITMAEFLLVIAGASLLVTGLMTLSQIIAYKQS